MIVIDGTRVIFLSKLCTGVDPMLRMTFIFLFYPMKFKTKLWVFPVSILIILLAATLHFMILIPIAYQAREWYEFSHDWVTKFIFYGFYFMVWLMWERIIKNNFLQGKKDPERNDSEAGKPLKIHS
jgi:exosortase/archaeosortase family protein